MLQIHRSIEDWIDRANIAIRSRISLTEIRDLIHRGREMPVELSDYLDKLQSRVRLADDWLNRLKEVVPCESPPPSPSVTHYMTSSGSDHVALQWMRCMRKAANNGEYNHLHELASEGSRIPVDVESVKLLQVELDAKNWSAKARKWIPNSPDEENRSIVGKKGKLDDLNEHLEKASALREKLALPDDVKKEWRLDYEKELQSIVDAAEDWYSNVSWFPVLNCYFCSFVRLRSMLTSTFCCFSLQYKPYLDWDNRRSSERSCLSIEKLRRIVNEGDSIFANLGSATAKMTRILVQAEGWLASYKPLLLRCKIIPREDDDTTEEKAFVTVAEMTEAVDAAATGISLNVDEAVSLQKIVQNIKDWSTRALGAAPKRSKRQGRTKKGRFSVDDIITLIQEAADLPVDTAEEVSRLQIQLDAVQEWRAKARVDIGNIVSGFRKLRDVVEDIYGKPIDFSRQQGDNKTDNNSSSHDLEMQMEPELDEEKKSSEDVSVCDETSSIADSEPDSGGLSHLGSGSCNVMQLIKAYKREAATTGVMSGEAEVADQLEVVSRWCVRSLRYLDTQRDVFDKRFFGAFDRFVAEGRELLENARDASGKQFLEDKTLGDALNAAWGDLVADQLQRLEILLVDRERFISWCDTAEKQLFTVQEKLPTLEKIKEVAEESKDFPSGKLCFFFVFLLCVNCHNFFFLTAALLVVDYCSVRRCPKSSWFVQQSIRVGESCQ